MASLGRWDEAVEAFAEALELGASNARLNLARALLESGRAREAIPHLRLHMREHGDDFEARLDLATALADVGEHDEARELVRSLMVEGSPPAGVHVLRGQLELARGDIDAAIEAFDAAHDLDPANVENLNSTARLLFRHGRDQEALDRLMRSLAIDPTQVAVHLAAAESLFTQGVPKAARAHVKEAIA